jgi:hypothetical protein
MLLIPMLLLFFVFFVGFVFFVLKLKGFSVFLRVSPW